MKSVPSDHQGYHKIFLRHDQEGMREIILNVRWKTLTLHPPIGKAKQYPDLQLTALIATEECSDNDTRIEWKLLTDLPVANLADNAQPRNTQGTGRTCFQRHRDKNIGHYDQRHSTSYVIAATGKIYDKTCPVGRIHWE